jgi:SOS-response transcriptional repressor LexA
MTPIPLCQGIGVGIVKYGNLYLTFPVRPGMTLNTYWPRGVGSMPPVGSNEFRGISATEAGEYIKARRQALGFTQAQVAERTGMPNDNYMVFYERARTDVRRSKYLAPLLSLLKITTAEAREHLGVDIVLDHTSAPESVPDLPRGARPVEGGVLIQHLGTVQAGKYVMEGGVMIRKGNTLVECPSPVARRYKAEDMFILDVTGDSMTCRDVQKRIPEGSSVLFHRNLEPRNNRIVVAWIPEIGPEGVGVLKVYKKNGNDEVVLESYNPRGPRLPAARYPGMRIQGVALTYWMDLV